MPAGDACGMPAACRDACRHACWHACSSHACSHACRHAGRRLRGRRRDGTWCRVLHLRLPGESVLRLFRRRRGRGSVHPAQRTAGVVVKASQNGQGRESCERAKRERATEKVGVPGSLFVFRGCLSLSVAVLFSCAFSAVLWSAKARSLCGPKRIKVRERREKNAVTEKETMFPFRSNTLGKT